jgi:hypothetical protein
MPYLMKWLIKKLIINCCQDFTVDESEMKAAEEVFDGKTCEFELQNFNANTKIL